GAEADERVPLYQRVGTQLSVVRSAAPGPVLVGRLSALVTRARAATTGSHEAAWRDVARFFTVSFPAALYRTRRWWALTALASAVVAVAMGWWVGTHAEVQHAVAT